MLSHHDTKAHLYLPTAHCNNSTYDVPPASICVLSLYFSAGTMMNLKQFSVQLTLEAGFSVLFQVRLSSICIQSLLPDRVIRERAASIDRGISKCKESTPDSSFLSGYRSSGSS